MMVSNGITALDHRKTPESSASVVFSGRK